MKYRGAIVDITKAYSIERMDKNGNSVLCDGYHFRIYADGNHDRPTDDFCAAVGFELPDGSIENAEMFAREYIDSEYKSRFSDRDKHEISSPVM